MVSKKSYLLKQLIFIILISRKVPKISSSSSDDESSTDTINNDEQRAKQHLQLGSIFTEKELMQNYKKMVQHSPENLLNLNQSMFILLKRKLGNKSESDLHSPHEKLYRDMICNTDYSEEQTRILLQLCHFDSLTHQKFYNAVQKVFKMKGSKEMKTNFELTIEGIQFPYSRNKQKFPPVTITGESKSRRLLEITVEGLSAMIFVSFFLKPILNEFVKSTGVETYNVPEIKTTKVAETEMQVEDKANLSNSESDSRISGTCDVGDGIQEENDDKKASEIDTQGYGMRNPSNIESGGEILGTNDAKDVTDTKNDSRQQSEKPSIFTKKDTKHVPENKTKKVTESENKARENPCYNCAFVHVIENVETLFHDEETQIDFSCVLKCGESCLQSLVRVICLLVVSQDISHTSSRILSM